MKWVALDIDGTITAEKNSCPEAVIKYLHHLVTKGWSIGICTGRSVFFARKVVDAFSFPFWLCAQNGAILLKMPEKKIFSKVYLSKKALSFVEEKARKVGAFFLVYAGYEKGEICYYHPEDLEGKYASYMQELQTRHPVPWKPLEEMEIESFPLIRCFGEKKVMEKLKNSLQKEPFQLSLVKDAFAEKVYLLQVTHPNASKGEAIKSLVAKYGKTVVIAAGDEENDLSLLQVADKKIAMEQAPESLKKIADCIASSPKKEGLLPTLQQVVKSYEAS